MKQMFVAIVLAALVASCDASGGNSEQPGDFSPPLPKGVYVAGWVNTEDGDSQGCYWVGDRRIMLDGKFARTISKWDGKLLITGYDINLDEQGQYFYEYYYWLDGKRHDTEWDRNATQFNGKTYTIKNGTYYIDDVGFPIPNFRAEVITVDTAGAVYVAGRDTELGYGCYYAAGQFHELNEFGYGSLIDRIMVSEGRVYVFRFANYNSYWVDGQRTAISLPEGYTVVGMAVYNDKIYMAGYYEQDDNFTACCWIDWKRYDLNGASASAIFVDE